MRPLHGGDLTAASAAFGEPGDGWLDLSTGINPIPYPIDSTLSLNWGHLPTKAEQFGLINAARNYYGVPPSAYVAASPGTQSIIQWLPKLRANSTVHIVGPTYNEHAHCWRLGGHDVKESSDFEDADVIVLVNPNNPTGRTFNPDKLALMAEYQASKDGWLIVDESFADVVPRASAIEHAGIPGLIILKSVGKFFGLAGARLGFIIGDLNVISEVESALGPWAVSGPSIAVGAHVLSDFDWQDDTLSRLERDADRLDQLLVTSGMKVLGGTPLFRLVEVSGASTVHKKLAEKGILVRVFKDFPDRIRFGLPGKEADWQRLQVALQALSNISSSISLNSSGHSYITQ